MLALLVLLDGYYLRLVTLFAIEEQAAFAWKGNKTKLLGV
jgi:hypothetical protein